MVQLLSWVLHTSHLGVWSTYLNIQKQPRPVTIPFALPALPLDILQQDFWVPGSTSRCESSKFQGKGLFREILTPSVETCLLWVNRSTEDPIFILFIFQKKSLQTKHIFTHQLYVSHPWRISSVGWQQMHRSKPRRAVFKNQICGLWVVCKKDEINDSMFDFLVTFLGIWLWMIGSCLGGALTSTGSGLLHKLVTTNPASEKCAARWREPYPTTWCVLLVDLADPTLGKCICCPNHPETYRAVHAREPWLLFPIGITNLTIIYKQWNGVGRGQHMIIIETELAGANAW